jgi:hypothetical protein
MSNPEIPKMRQGSSLSDNPEPEECRAGGPDTVKAQDRFPLI